MSDIRFDERVAIVTGAGGGLGRSHALLLAARGAKVVVNDLGGSVDGEGASQKAADAVVAEIEAAGGTAVANYDSVADEAGAAGIVKTAIDSFGRVDIVVNNAGILRDVSFHKMTVGQWDAVVAVHLRGTALVTRAAWPHMREAGYGRVVNTSSAAGLYGNFGQTSYGAAKLGIVGLTKALAQEGFKKGILANTIAPVAKSRMTESILPPEVLAKLEPERVSPLVALLASESFTETGRVFAVGGGYISRVEVVEAPGVVLDDGFTPEDVAAQIATASELGEAKPYANAMDAIGASLKRI